MSACQRRLHTMNFIEITDINAPELDVFSRVSETQLYRYFEPEIGIFLAESANVILRALEAGYEPLSMLVEKNRIEIEVRPVFDAIEKICGREKLESMPIYTAESDIVTNLTGYTLVRGLWMVLRRKPEEPVEEFCRDKKRIRCSQSHQCRCTYKVSRGSRNGRGTSFICFRRSAYKTIRESEHGNRVSDSLDQS